jgi:cytochrome c oxidase subunit IV
MSHNHHQDIQELYEGDQSKLYSGVLSHHHDIESAESKAQVARIWKITGLLAIVTIVEVLLGLYGYHIGLPHWIILTFFLLLTLVKAAKIVQVFMHLGDEVTSFITTVLLPLLLFIWIVIAFLYDGNFWLHMNLTTPTLFH